MTSQQTRRCCHVSGDGTQCKAHPQGYSEYCFFHDPLMQTERAAASRAGGLTSTHRAQADPPLPPDLLPISLETAADVAYLMRETIQRLCHGEINLRTATSLGYLASILMTATERAAREEQEAAAHAAAAESAPAHGA
jgi:hypothetical protein